MTKDQKLIEKLKELIGLRDNITKGKWFATDFAGYWQILNGPHYDDDDILDSDLVGEKRAKANAELMVMAPKLLNFKIASLEAEIEQEEKTVSDEEIDKEAYNYCATPAEFGDVQFDQKAYSYFLDGAKWMRDKLLNK